MVLPGKNPVSGTEVPRPCFVLEFFTQIMIFFRTRFRFGALESTLAVADRLPPLPELADGRQTLIVCDENTLPFVRELAGRGDAGICVLPPGEKAKTWASAEKILEAALEAGLGRDGLFLGLGGGVVMDLAGFAASVYMRGVRLRLVPTTLLGMVDAALGGKTGFDLFGLKNLAGTFYPAERVYAPGEALFSLPAREWKSGMADLIKTALRDESGELPALLREHGGDLLLPPVDELPRALPEIIAGAMEIKGRIVEEDPRETGGRRALLNLGHTFGHALEAAAGLGRLAHGEAVAWGMARAAELGAAKGVTPPRRAGEILEMLSRFEYELRAPHPLLAGGGDRFFAALKGDKKTRNGETVFVVPAAKGAETLAINMETGDERNLVETITFGA
jgi:3-dehydroquinate synthase